MSRPCPPRTFLGHVVPARDQRGTSLVLVLAAMAVLSLLVPAMLVMTGTGLAVTRPVLDDRVEVYAATSALDAAVAHGRVDPDIGAAGANCPTTVTTINGLAVTVDCENPAFPDDGCFTVDRFVTFHATVRRPGNSKILLSVSNQVAYRFDPSGTPRVEVRQYSSDPSAPVTTVPEASCHGDEPPSTTTTTTTTTVPPTTTTTTTTTVPQVPPVHAEWTDISTTGSTTNWQATAYVRVTDENGSTVKGAAVVAKVEYRTNGTNTWIAEPVITDSTNSQGLAKVKPAKYKVAKEAEPVIQARFTITSVTKNGYQWIDPNDDSSILLIDAPS